MYYQTNIVERVNEQFKQSVPRPLQMRNEDDHLDCHKTFGIAAAPGIRPGDFGHDVAVL